MTVKVYSPVLPSVEVFGAHEGIASATGINQTVSLTFTPTEGTLVVVPYGDTVSQLQLEVGPTPSSHIPTEDAEVTRAADIMTVPAANMPWPEPVVIGEELVTNGTFDTDTDWTKGTGWTISGGVASTASGLSGSLLSPYSGNIIAGGCYLVSVDVNITTGGNLFVQVAGGGSVNIGTVGTRTETFYLVAGSSTGYDLNFFANTTIVGSIDNISVKEINPLAVSIQMDGTMTYADEGNVNEVSFFDWIGTGLIQARVDTQSTLIGRTRFRQVSDDAVSDQVLGAGDDYSPGINVPFNIASRHGSTFINGAVDGVALTANTTPTALPDLSATDFDIAPDFMGNISKLRVWADDIGDDGLEQSTS